MTPPQTITGVLHYQPQAVLLKVQAGTGPPIFYLLLMDFPPGGNSVPTQAAAARALLMNHGKAEGCTLSVSGFPKVPSPQPVIQVIEVL